MSLRRSIARVLGVGRARVTRKGDLMPLGKAIEALSRYQVGEVSYAEAAE